MNKNKQPPQSVMRKKDGQAFACCYYVGRKDLLLEAFVTEAKKPQSSHDWFDAAGLAHVWTEHLKKMDWSEHLLVLGRELVVC